MKKNLPIIKKILFICFILFGIFDAIYGKTILWNGPILNNNNIAIWNKDSNWSEYKIPSNTDKVIFNTYNSLGPKRCILDKDANVFSICFYPANKDTLDFNGNAIYINGDTADFKNCVENASKKAKIFFINKENCIFSSNNNLLFSNIIVKSERNKIVSCQNFGITTDSLIVDSGVFNLGKKLIHNIKNIFIKNGGIDFNISTVIFEGENIDLAGSNYFDCNYGKIIFKSYNNQIMSLPSDSINIHYLVKKGSGTLIVKKILNTGFYIDTLIVDDGELVFSDSLFVYVNHLISSNGKLCLPKNSRLYINSFADFSGFDSLSLNGKLIFYANKNSAKLSPPKNYKFSHILVSKGKLELIEQGILADTITILPACSLYLGERLIHHTNFLSFGRGSIIDFGTSTLNYTGDTIDFSNVSQIITRKSYLEFSNKKNVYILPSKQSSRHPSIICNINNSNLILLGNFYGENLKILSGKFSLNGFYASFDSLTGNIGSLSDTLDIGNSNNSVLYIRKYADFNNVTVTGTLRIETIEDSNKDILIPNNLKISKFNLSGSNITSVYSVNDSEIVIDTILIGNPSSTLSFDKNKVPYKILCKAFKSLNGYINFGDALLYFYGDTLDLSQTKILNSYGLGGIELYSKLNQLFIPPENNIIPLIIKSGKNKTTILKKGFICNKFILKEGTISLGNSLTHTILSNFNIYSGNLDFGSSILVVKSDTVDFSYCDTIICGNGSLSLFSDKSIQFFIPKKYASHPNIIKNGKSHLKITQDLMANKLWIGDGIFDIQNKKCVLTGLSAIAGKLYTGEDSLIINGNAIFTGLDSIKNGNGVILVKTNSTSPVSFFSCTTSVLNNVVFLISSASQKSRIIFGEGNHKIKSCYFVWSKDADSAIFDFKKNNAGLIIYDSVVTLPLQSEKGNGLVYTGNSFWKCLGDFKITNLITDSLKVIFAKDSGNQSIKSLNKVSNIIHSGKGRLCLLSGIKCKNFYQSNGTLDFNGYYISCANDFIIQNDSNSCIAYSKDGWKIETGRNTFLTGKINKLLNIACASACTINSSGTLSAKYCILKNCIAEQVKGIAYKSIDSTGNKGWTFSNKPSNVSLIASKKGNGFVKLLWNKNLENDIIRYFIYCDTGNGKFIKVDSTSSLNDTFITINNLINGKLYKFCITSKDSAGYESDFSGIVSVIPDSSIFDINIKKISFDKVAIGTQKDSVFLINNNTNDTIFIQFSFEGSSCFIHKLKDIKILPQQSLLDTISFIPQINIGNDSALLILFTQRDKNVLKDTIILRGQGFIPKIYFTPETLFIDSLNQQKQSLAIAIKNYGIDTIILSKIYLYDLKNNIIDSLPHRANIMVLYPQDSYRDTICLNNKISGNSMLFLGYNLKTNIPFDTLIISYYSSVNSKNNNSNNSSIPQVFNMEEFQISERTIVFKYSLPLLSHVTIDIYNAIGRFIERTLDITQPPQDYQFTWDGSHLSKGIYFCRFKVIDPSTMESKYLKTIRLVFTK